MIIYLHLEEDLLGGAGTVPTVAVKSDPEAAVPSAVSALEGFSYRWSLLAVLAPHSLLFLLPKSLNCMHPERKRSITFGCLTCSRDHLECAFWSCDIKSKPASGGLFTVGFGDRLNLCSTTLGFSDIHVGRCGSITFKRNVNRVTRGGFSPFRALQGDIL